MRGYERDEDGYYDDYEDEDEGALEGEEEDEYEKVEERKPTAGELKYLALRQQIKEQIRNKRQKESGSPLAKSQEKKTKLPFSNFGSFFGPSQPVIAQRVIQESKSLLENPHLAMKLATSNSGNKKVSASTATSSRKGASQQIPKYKKEMQVKAQKLKNTRDYSFLLSDDAEIPAPAKQSAPRNVNAPRSEARSAPMPQKSKRPLPSINSRSIQGHHEERRSHSSLNGQMQPKPGQQKTMSASKPNSASIDSRRQLGSNNGVGPGRPVGQKGLPAKPPVATLDKKVLASGSKSLLPPSRKPLPSTMQPSVSKQPVQQRPLQHRPSEQKASEQRRRAQEPSGAKMVPKKVQVPLKPQINKQVKPVPSKGSLHDARPKKKPVRPETYSDDDEAEHALSMIRKMFNTNRYAGRYDDDDDSDMEANFDDIMEEERRSAKIARREDEEQLRLIEEEERRERMRKKRKLAQAR